MRDFTGTDTAMCLVRQDAVCVMALKDGTHSIRLDGVAEETLKPVGRVRRFNQSREDGRNTVEMTLRAGALAILER